MQDTRETLEQMRAVAAKAGDVRIMEVCGTHTMSIARAGLKALLPPSVKLISGPGCPVCVTDQSYIDCAIHLAGLGASKGGPIIATYGDMVRVPGRQGSLGEARSRGSAVEVVYSAMDAVELAKVNPSRQVVFLAVGFETTAPGTALAVLKAKGEGVGNFSVLTAHKVILPAMRVLLQDPQTRIDAFLCPGHVSVILGYEAYKPLVDEFAKPCVVAGFDAGQVATAVLEILREIADGRPRACTIYPSVSPGGNKHALDLLRRVFKPCDAVWRALGTIPGSGVELADEFAAMDARSRFDLPQFESYEMPGCRCGEVLAGRCEPRECKLFGTACTPLSPIGPCMVSSEGSCAAEHKYGRAR